MKNVAEIYCCELKKNLDRFGVWKPGNRIDLGDIISIKNGIMTYEANLLDFDISYETEVESYDPKAEEEYQSNKAVSIRPVIGAAIQDSNKVNLDVEISFKRENAIFYSAKGLKNMRIKNQIKLAKVIESLYKTREWDKEWSVITHLTIVDSAVVIISKTRNAKIVLNGKGSPDVGSVHVTDLNLGFDFSKDVGINFKQKFKTPTPLLFQAKHIKHTIFAKDRFVKHMVEPPQKIKEKIEWTDLTDEDWDRH